MEGILDSEVTPRRLCSRSDLSSHVLARDPPQATLTPAERWAEPRVGPRGELMMRIAYGTS